MHKEKNEHSAIQCYDQQVISDKLYEGGHKSWSVHDLCHTALSSYMTNTNEGTSDHGKTNQFSYTTNNYLSNTHFF